MRSTIRSIAYVLRNLESSKSYVFQVLLLSIFTILIDIMSIWFLMDIISYYIENKGTTIVAINRYFPNEFSGSIILLLVVLFVGSKFFISKKQLNSTVNFHSILILKLRSFLVKKYLNESYIEHKKRNLSEIVNITNVELINTSILIYNVLLLIIEFILILGLLVALSIIDIYSTLLFLLYMCLIYLVFAKYAQEKQKIISVERLVTKEKITRDVMNIHNGFLDWMVFDKRNLVFDYFSLNSQVDNNLFKRQQKYVGSSRIYLEASGFLVILLFVNVLLFNNVETKNVFVFILLLIRIVPSFQKLLFNFQIINQNLPSLRLIESEMLSTNVKLEKLERNKFSKTYLSTNSKIEYLNIQYKIGDKELFNIDRFELHRGYITSVIGPSGAGKSSLLYCLMGNYLDSEAKCIVGNKTFSLGQRTYRNQVAYVPQNVFIFKGSLFDNVSMFDCYNETNINKVKMCLQKVGLTDLLARYNNNFSHKLGESGKNLSGGQIQRLGIARAIYSNRPILMLDEFTSNLDLQTERDILETLSEIKNDHFILIVSHRSEPLKFSDDIYQLLNGVLSKI